MTSINSPESELIALRARVQNLRDNVARAGEALLRRWNLAGTIMGPGVDPANLAHYLALRRHDLEPLQRALAAHGLSSLGRSEARVLPALDALLATLARLTGDGAPHYPSVSDMSAGNDTIETASERIFGPGLQRFRPRILVTLPVAAAEDPELVDRLMAAGMDCARINCGHDDKAIWARMIAHIRAAELRRGRRCPVLMDISGPKCRIARVEGPKSCRIVTGDRIALLRDIKAAKDKSLSFTINFPHLIEDLSVGDTLSLDDGRARARVVATGKGYAELEICAARAKGILLKPDKGVSFPPQGRGLPVLTDKDFRDLDFIAVHADLVGFSFVRRPEDVELLQAHLSARRGDAPPQAIVLKIETPLAVANLPRLILQAASRNPTAVMIARGDLAVELGFARLSEIQEEILWLCEAAHTPVIWATEVLNQFVKEGVMSRPETTDAAMSQQAECVMLNKGPFLQEGVAFLSNVLDRMQRHHAKKFARFTPLHAWDSEFEGKYGD